MAEASWLHINTRRPSDRIPQSRAALNLLDATALPSFVDPLPLPVLQTPSGVDSPSFREASVAPYYRIDIREASARFHRDLPATKIWTYGRTATPILFDVRSNRGVLIDWHNKLPTNHLLHLNSIITKMEDVPATRTVTHVHGARVPAISDGYPDDWFGPGAHRLCYYPNQQEAAFLWFHDHAMGMSRFNVVAGLIGLYIVRDEAEQKLGLPHGEFEIPLLIYDRSFDRQGQLYYPTSPDEGLWTQEFTGDAMIVNGKIRPYHRVQARKYRIRIANAANARFFSLSFSNEQNFHVIGSDQGLFPAPVEMTRVVLAPAERVDLVVDFGGVRGGNVVLQSDGLDLMQFRVSREQVVDRSRLPQTLAPAVRLDEQSVSNTRFLTLDEFDTDNGQAMIMLLNRRRWRDPVTERVKLGSTEIWNLINLTEDTHPIHLHEVRFHILDRRPFSVDDYLADATLRYVGDASLPLQNEIGWKDVVQCPPETVTRIIISFQGYPGRYLWHCHLLEHEANEMMRPYEIYE